MTTECQIQSKTVAGHLARTPRHGSTLSCQSLPYQVHPPRLTLPVPREAVEVDGAPPPLLPQFKDALHQAPGGGEGAVF
jgi:hypothetical protein